MNNKSSGHIFKVSIITFVHVSEGFYVFAVIKDLCWTPFLLIVDTKHVYTGSTCVLKYRNIYTYFFYRNFLLERKHYLPINSCKHMNCLNCLFFKYFYCEKNIINLLVFTSLTYPEFPISCFSFSFFISTQSSSGWHRFIP